MKEALILAFGTAQSLLVWIILQLRDKVGTLEEENNVLAKMILQLMKEDN